MYAGLPWTTWLLLLGAVSIGPALILRFHFIHGRNDSQSRVRGDSQAPPAGDG